MNCSNFSSDMALAMGLYDLSPQCRRTCGEVLQKRGSRLSWEALSMALQAPFHVDEDEIQLALLNMIRESPDLPKIAAQVVTFFSYIQKYGQPNVRDALRLLQEDLGSNVMVKILTGYPEDVS